MIHIVGHGIAGAMLAWELDRRGISFRVYDPGSTPTGSKVGAGIINPVTGQRWVKSWRVDTLFRGAESTYREIERVTGSRLYTSLRVRRYFQSPAEERTAREKVAAGQLRPYITEAGVDSCWISPAARVDTGALVDVLGQRWQARGWWRAEEAPSSWPSDDVVIRCIGAAECALPELGTKRLSLAKGEILTVRAEHVDTSTIVNAGNWVLPIDTARARVGATYARDQLSLECTPAAREHLLSFARKYLGDSTEVVSQEVGLRASTSDRLPVVGWLCERRRLGIVNGLGSKGALFAPCLAQQWAEHLTSGRAFDPELDVRRFLP
jgi:glycine/D-amino acid oxidase-like deaminating enzyme